MTKKKIEHVKFTPKPNFPHADISRDWDAWDDEWRIDAYQFDIEIKYKEDPRRQKIRDALAAEDGKITNGLLDAILEAIDS